MRLRPSPHRGAAHPPAAHRGLCHHGCPVRARGHGQRRDRAVCHRIAGLVRGRGEPMTAGSSKAGQLRALIADGQLVRAVGAHDGLSARLVEQAGFEAVWVSSFELSASYALPDASLLDLTRYLDEARSIEAVTQVPVIADCDTGFGGPLNVAHAVRAYEASGIAAICIEDKVFPKMNSFADVRHDLLPAEEFELKIKAGKRAQAG